MQEYKMLCLDIDGTLLNSEYRISEKTKKYIQEAVSHKHIIVILVSARMPQGIFFLHDELALGEQPVICYGGAMISDRKGNAALNKKISSGDLNYIYKAARKYGIHTSIYDEMNWFVERIDSWAENESSITGIIPSVTDLNELMEYYSREGRGINKVLCMADPYKIEMLSRDLKANGSKLSAHLSKPTYLEIMPADASKTAAVEYISQRLEISREEVIAVGDNYNDIDMIKYAGLGVAMGNAPEQVKIHAGFVTFSNDEDGIAEVIRRYVL